MSNLGNKEVFAKNLCFYMDRYGKTQKELAEVVGVSRSTFNDWTKGRIYPRIDKIEILANYFGVLKSDLIENAKENSPGERPLTEGEKELLELFRLVPEDNQPLVIQMIKVAIDNLR